MEILNPKTHVFLDKVSKSADNFSLIFLIRLITIIKLADAGEHISKFCFDEMYSIPLLPLSKILRRSLIY